MINQTKEIFIELYQKYNKFLVLLVDFFLLSFAFIVPVWIEPETIDFFLPTYALPFLVFSFTWISISYVFGKYNLKNFKNQIHLLATITLIAFLALSTISIVLFSFKINWISRAVVLGTILLCYLFEIIVFRMMLTWVQPLKIKEEKAKEEVPIAIYQKPKEISRRKRILEDSFLQKTEAQNRESMITFEAGPNVYNYFAEHVDVENESIFLTSTTTAFNINSIPVENIGGIINLKKVNDMRYINKFFEAVNLKLRDTGMYIGCVETSRQRYKRIEKKYPKLISKIIIIIDFLLNRVIPRISFLKKIYFNISSGVRRAISKAEVLGRLVSCGFDIIEYKEINNLTYFVVMKTGEPEYNLSPSYGPLFKMPRVGKDGMIFYVFKFRTMHPFSEYLQDYVLRLNGYTLFGKPAEDFRLTEWGRFLRKFWLDELPQLINVLKGEMKLVGIRPLSKRALADYPEDVKKKRIKCKPGCIPPYVALLKQGMEQSIEAERIYLSEIEKYPFKTDLKYFGLALFNIITNKIRSA